MAYLALYRRFRPTTFDGVIGQDHIVRTLKNQIKTGRIGHAYLFCGARGTGKTSTAKIFARAINCLSPKDGSPCGECEACKALAESSNLDILEMDAASNNKVENVREIREKIQYPPVAGKYKVYIIDEVHMLTTEAFNALLKTLEEPPEHAVFILATTEAHKLPATILSRCMRFDFKLIPTAEVAGLIRDVYKEIGKDCDEEAIYAIARAGGGCIRDALSIADICVSYRDGKLTYGDVLEVLGGTDSDSITRLIGAILSSNTGEALETVEKLADGGKNVGVLCRDVITRLREIIICKSCKNGKEILELPEEIYESVKAAGESAPEAGLLRAVEIFGEAEATLRYTQTPRVVLETAVIKASMPENDYNLEALISRISALENALKGGAPIERKTEKDISEPKKTAEIKPVEKDKIEQVDFGGYLGLVPPPIEFDEVLPTEKKTEIKPQTAAKPEVLPSAGRLWGTVIRKLRADGNIMLWVACQEMSAVLQGKTLKILAKDESGYAAVTKADNLAVLSKTVKSVGDYDVEVVMESMKEAETDKDIEKMRELFGADKVKVTD